MKINPEFDPMGRAIVDYFEQQCEKSPLVVSSSLFEDDVMPVANLFRTESQMPVLERHLPWHNRKTAGSQHLDDLLL